MHLIFVLVVGYFVIFVCLVGVWFRLVSLVLGCIVVLVVFGFVIDFWVMLKGCYLRILVFYLWFCLFCTGCFVCIAGGDSECLFDCLVLHVFECLLFRFRR